jgi:hypothetical protein
MVLPNYHFFATSLFGDLNNRYLADLVSVAILHNGLQRLGRRTPRRWGWGNPRKKRTATRIKSLLYFNGLAHVNEFPAFQNDASENHFIVGKRYLFDC